MAAALLISSPLTEDLSAWYARDGLACALTLAGLAVDGFIVSLGGQSLFGRWLFEDEWVSSAARHHERGGPSHDAVFGLAPDPDAERLDFDAECRKNIGEELRRVAGRHCCLPAP